MSLIIYFLYLSALVISILLFFTILIYAKNRTSRLFLLIIFSMFLWIITNFFTDTARDREVIKIFLPLTIIGPILLAPTIPNFVRSFLNKPNDRYSKLGLLYLVSALILPLTFTNLNILEIDIIYKPNEFHDYIYTFKPGILYEVLGVFLLICLMLSAWLYIKGFKMSNKSQKIQLKIIAIGFSLSIVISVFFALLIPNFIEDTSSSILAPVSSIIFLLTTAYAILRYQFLDIRLFIGRITYFSLNAFIAYVVFYLILYINLLLFKQPITPEGMLLGVVFSILFVLVYDATNRFIREKVTLRIINPGFDPNVETARLNKKISSMLGISQITKAVFTTLAKTIRPSTKIILLNSDKISDVITDTKELKSPEHSKTLNIIFNKLQQVDISYLNYFEVQNIVETANIKNNFIFYKEVFQLMEEMTLRLVVTIRSQEGKIIGLICLGPKDSDIPYTRSEQNFVYDIGEIISLSVDRSLLYKEVQQFNETLQDKVDIATRELTQANTKLAEALKKEKDMMDIIGHELRTPLGAARNALIFLDTLKQKGKMTDARFKQFMETAIRNIRREKEILETILQSARLDNDRIQFDPTDVNIQELIKQSFEGFGDMAKQKNLEVILDIEPRLTIRCDQVAIQQIVDNLASNAVKYTHKGSITIRIKKAENNKIRFEFIDTGEGLKPEDIPNLGKKFFRANTHLQTGGTIGGDLVPRPGGTGIGLYVIKGLLESMGSELKIESEFGKGSKFWFELEDSSEV